MNTIHKAFTLVELLIVLVIVGIMSVLLFRTFGDMTRISFRLNQEYMISQTMTQIHTTMTTLLDTYPYLTGVTDKPQTLSGISLVNTQGHTISISQTGNCLTLSGCSLAITSGSDTIILTNTDTIAVSNLSFVLLPSSSSRGFWMSGMIYTRSPGLSGYIYEHPSLVLHDFFSCK